MKTFLSLVLLFIFSINIGYCQQSDFDIKVIRMLELSGAKQNFDVALESMIKLQKDAYGDYLSDAFFDSLAIEMKISSVEKLIPLMVPIYKKHLTEDQIDGIIVFYESEVGKALISKTPLIISEAMEVGGKWGKEIGEELVNKIEKSHVLDFDKKIPNDCSRFESGIFEETGNDNFTAKITKEKGVQTEEYNGITAQYSISWVSNNRYVLSAIDGEGNEIDGMEITVNIYEVTADSYKYVAMLKGSDDLRKGEIKKLN